MENTELKKYAELLISMSTDFLLGKISDELYLSNIQLIADKLKED